MKHTLAVAALHTSLTLTARHAIGGPRASILSLAARQTTGGARLATLTLAVLASACGRSAPSISATDLGVEPIEQTTPACTPSPTPAVDTVASGLEIPWDVTFHSDGRAFVTERTGTVRVIDPEVGLLPDPWASIDIYTVPGSEVGLMGVDLSPDGSSLYVAATVGEPPAGLLGRAVGGVARRITRMRDPDQGHLVTLSVFRIPVGAEGAGQPEEIVSGLPANFLHGGGALRTRPDGTFHLSNGDGLDPWWAQDELSPRGKILRYDAGGTPMPSERFPGTAIHAIGIRHVQGMAWHPVTGEMVVIDHGPTGLPMESFRTDQDELSVVAEGANLGWPIVAGAHTGDGGLTSPIVEWDPSVAPAGLDIPRVEGGLWEGDALVATLRGALRRIDLEVDDTATALNAVCQETVLEGYGRLRLVRQAPDGSIWVGTSNRDGRGGPRPSDDLILRLRGTGTP